MGDPAQADGKDGEKNTTEAAKDPTYFFPHGFTILKVEDTLFRIPLFHLLQHSGSGIRFGSLFRQPAEGSSEENPLVLDDISVKEFRHFLRITLPSATAVLPLFSPHVQQVLPHWKEYYWDGSTLYREFAKNGSVSDSEMEAIGAVESFIRINQEANSLFRSQSLEITIKKTFKAEISSIAAAEKYLVVPVAQVIDSSVVPLHKQNPPPCNDHYLMTCSKEDCKYSHNYALTPEQVMSLADNAKKMPCHWLQNGLPCPYADKCCWGHVCPNGSTCPRPSKGKGRCRFKGESMHSS